ncbi:pyridoxamine 5'-phosphate oxidase family protein [Marinivivus vitaminiproducens]|uniref:pyridoxamine 5'-phosphate oxidase family protein n=1 Tax=Marinivivus vitaminiproducens TaxID=3035935 RepID=UPI0027A965AC|nr:pyridoxamine 5'-phosphate oxidase family protein [Geminicoccaceae bacterium SCSIO 64248]
MDSESDDACASWRDHYGPAMPLALKKQLPALDKHARAFIERSPFLTMATVDANGRADCSPRGDQPGFVRVLDDATLFLPDRPGNNRLDSLGNIASHPDVGLLFLIPGINETLRVNGKAAITTETSLLAGSAVKDRTPKSGLVIAVEEVFFHCTKALVRARLWAPEAQAARSEVTTLARVLADQIEGVDAEKAEMRLAESERERLY